MISYRDILQSPTPVRAITKAPNKVKTCRITLSYSLKNIPSNVDQLKRDIKSFADVNVSNNAILDEIMKNYDKLHKSKKILILVDGNRYDIELITERNKEVILKQYFKHYDGVRENLIPVSVRYVQLVFV